MVYSSYHFFAKGLICMIFPWSRSSVRYLYGCGFGTFANHKLELTCLDDDWKKECDRDSVISNTLYIGKCGEYWNGVTITQPTLLNWYQGMDNQLHPWYSVWNNYSCIRQSQWRFPYEAARYLYGWRLPQAGINTRAWWWKGESNCDPVIGNKLHIGKYD